MFQLIKRAVLVLSQRLFGRPRVIYDTDSLRVLAARYGFDDFAITFNPGAGAQALTAYVTEFNGLDIEAVLEEVTAAGDAADVHAAVGLTTRSPFTIGGPYNDASNGPDDLFAGNEGDTFEVVITWGGSKTSTFDAILKRYNRGASRGALTKFEAEFQPTGAITEA